MKEFLSQRDLPYREYNITQDRNAFEEMWHISGQKAAPVVTVNGEVVIGFAKEKLESLLQNLS
ncbi:MAG: glutaredoxin family protein [Bacillota bacterium]|nr:glutaredoxin family protein [Bacillota bacterium]MDW7684632.1 glutaredoxin family protein [Bacillota bacterium]